MLLRFSMTSNVGHNWCWRGRDVGIDKVVIVGNNG